MWQKGWRNQVWQQLDRDWDILIIGGGITGAGILRRAVAEGYKALLVEAGDFASGTSSRSSKLVHGGFRYLRNKQFNVTRESVREREWLLREAKQLVTPLGFLMPCPPDQKIARQFGIGVMIYDLLAPKWKHSHLNRQRMLEMCPSLAGQSFNGGYLYYDAAMDDVRVVLRLLRESVAAGGIALNYTRATNHLRTVEGRVCGAVLKDTSGEKRGNVEAKARVVINATGPWSDEVRHNLGAPPRLRKLRGSHLVFSRDRININQAITLLHPRDFRAMFAIPWEGVTLVGTTDLDHSDPLDSGETFATLSEIDYILEAASATFPKLNLNRSDVISSFSGLRPVVNTGQVNPSKESRAHVVWDEQGLITITGGKYTTFRIMAEQTLQRALPYLPHPADFGKRQKYFKQLPQNESTTPISAQDYLYLSGRYGDEIIALLNCAEKGENESILNLPNFWSEIRWAARDGAVEHLDDLLLRRVRLGLLLPDGANSLLERVRAISQPELGWDDNRWQAEETRYREIYTRAYSPSPAGYAERTE